MPYDFSPLKNKLREINDWLRHELTAIRTGRATPALLDAVTVNVYASRTPLKNLAAIVIEDARTLRVSPWAKDQIKAIELTITAANLGVSVQGDGEGLRVIFPELTSESRQRFSKVVRLKLEEARQSGRQARDKVWGEIQKNERDKKISEDDKFRYKEELQKITDRGNQELEAAAEKKIKEILN